MRSDKKKKNKLFNNKGNGQTSAGTDGTVTKKKYRLNKKRFFLFLLSIFLIMILSVAIYVAVIIVNAPKINTDNIYDIITESTVIYDDKGQEIDTVYSDNNNRTNIEFNDLPDNMVNAIVALEDKTFWKHHGFNFIRIFGAIKESLFSGGSISGTSTITQQLARNVYLVEDKDKHNLKRKIIEAYYTVILEKNLTKKQILEAYLNSIYFGYGTYGIQSASQAYFSKDVQDLTLAQCAALAAIPQQPTGYQMVEYVAGTHNVSKNNKNILKRTSRGTYIVNDESKDRRELCLDLMLEQEYITQEQHDKAAKRTLKNILKPMFNLDQDKASYFTDYVINEVISDLMEQEGYTYDEAWERVYKGGYKIYTSMDSQAQKVIETEFENDANFPTAINIMKDGNGNIINKYGQIVLYDYDDYFNSGGDFTLTKSEITKKKDGSVVIKSDKRLNIYDTEVNNGTDYSIEFKNMYIQENGKLYAIEGGYINIPAEYKTKNKYGNIIISADFFKNKEYKDYFIFNDDGTLTVTADAYTLNQKVIQPQAAMTIIDNSTGEIKAIVGGRETSGRMLLNRASDSPRQPGSSIKPLAVYSAAIQQSAEEAASGKAHQFVDYGIDKQGTKYWGKYLTAGSVVIDEKTVMDGKVWPSNAGGGYSGVQTMRTALQQSINTCAVKIFLQVGTDFSANLVQKYGITTLVTSGDVSDMNPAALALGGMTKGVTTLEMASAYTVFPNNGKRIDTSSYTKVLDAKGNAILTNKTSESHRVLNSGVAWIMADMLKSVITNGIGYPAAISGVQAGGKTGTTSDQFDIWFDGFTPSYSASLWIGNDVNIELSNMSGTAAALWGKIMNQIDGAKEGTYKNAPSNVIRSGNEYYIKGTQGGTFSPSEFEKEVTICTDSGYLATPDCPNTKKEKYVSYDNTDDIPQYYCNLHNPDVKKYPISPDEELQDNNNVIKPDDPEDNPSEKPDVNPPSEGGGKDDDEGEGGDKSE